MFRKRNVMLPSEVKCASRVKCAFGTRLGTHHFTANEVSNITMRSITSLRLAATSLLSHEFKSILKNEKYLFYKITFVPNLKLSLRVQPIRVRLFSTMCSASGT